MPNDGGQTSNEKKATEDEDRSLSLFEDEGRKDQKLKFEKERFSATKFRFGLVLFIIAFVVVIIIVLTKPHSSKGEQTALSPMEEEQSSKDEETLQSSKDEETVLSPRLPPSCMEEDRENPYASGIHCEPCMNEVDDSCVLNVKVNLFASETGYFEVEGCDGVNPTLLLTLNKTYIFDQSDESNHFHLIGFAYEADGLHIPVDELEPGIAPPGSASDCDKTFTCPAPMYWMNDEYQGKYSNAPNLFPIPEEESYDFGLDVVEPLFFHPFGDWYSYGAFKTTLRFHEANFNADIFYFCHMFPGMSGRIKLLDNERNPLSEEDKPELPYTYTRISPFDVDCGTFNTTDYCDPTYLDQCPDSFICGNEMKSSFAKCTEATNCRMISSITTVNGPDLVLFSRQMIAHMQNAINIAKAFLKTNNPVCTPPVEEYPSWLECRLSDTIREIINTQLDQINTLRDALDYFSEPEVTNCSIPLNLGVPKNTGWSIMDKEESGGDSSVFEAGIDCDPCAGRDDENVCEIKVKVNRFAGKSGYFEIEGCAGVNPTIYLTVGRTYRFDQSDSSNWYHLIGFAYEADGWHVPVDELEPGVVPPGSTSNCDETLSCPSPMYWLNNEYKGNYSNAPNLIPIPKEASDDYGIDNVEFLFRHPIGDWEWYGSFATTLTFDVESFDLDIFYFDVINEGMSGRIKLRDAEGNLLSPEDRYELPYAYDSISPYDHSCGTFGLVGSEASRTGSHCPTSFMCGSSGQDKSSYANCADSINCAMLHDIASSHDNDDDTVLFLRQMIALGRNAVNMAKAILKSGAIHCNFNWRKRRLSPYSGPDCWLQPVVYSIINQQSYYVELLEMGFDDLRVEERDDCNF